MLRELRKLRVSSVGDQPAADEVVIRATYLILATAAGFVSCLIPVLGAEVHLVVDPDAPIKPQLQYVSGIVFDGYSIFNTVICAVLKKAYQIEARKVCCSGHIAPRQVNVAPMA